MPTVDASLTGKRCDIAARDLFGETRSTILHWIKEDRLLINGTPAKASQKVSEGDRLEVIYKAPVAIGLEPMDLSLDILYEDADVAVINKPEGLTVHPASTTNEATLVHGLLYQIKDLGAFDDAIRPGIVHRLDKDTSGALVIAKNKPTLLALQAALKKRTIKREYVALVRGQLAHEKGTIDAPIGRHPVKRQSMAVTPNGKPSITHFKVLERFDEATYIACELESGRTHQIRVHMAHLNHPVLGDPKYGSARADGTGQFLHARKLSFVHPSTKKPMVFEAPLPDHFEALLAQLRSS